MYTRTERKPSRPPYQGSQNADRDRGERPGFRSGPFRGGGMRFIKKICRFCSDSNMALDYKDPEKLRRFLTEKGKIIPRRITGNCAKHQRMLARIVKRARHAAVVAFQID